MSQPKMRFLVDQHASPFSIFFTETGCFLWGDPKVQAAEERRQSNARSRGGLAVCYAPSVPEVKNHQRRVNRCNGQANLITLILGV